MIQEIPGIQPDSLETMLLLLGIIGLYISWKIVKETLSMTKTVLKYLLVSGIMVYVMVQIYIF